LFLLIPFFVEIVNVKSFLFAVPGIPLSLGGLCLVIFGTICLWLCPPKKSHIFYGLLIIYLGSVIGGFLSNQVVENLSNSAGKIVLLIGALGLAQAFRMYNLKLLRMIDLFMVGFFAYWVQYILGKTILSGNFISYTTLFFTDRSVNHHIAGMNVTVAAIYLASRLYDYPGTLRNVGYMLIGIGAVCCLLIESRSNLIMAIASAAWLILQDRKVKLIYLILAGLFFFAFFIASVDFLDSYNFLNTRFDIHDQAYQHSSNISRLYIYQHFIPFFLESPVGRGFVNTRMMVDYMELNMHNQFLSFIVGGGVLAIFGVILFWRKFLQILGYARLKAMPEAMRAYTRSLTGMAFVFTLTLLSIDNGGALFLFVMAVLMFLEAQFDFLKKFERTAFRKITLREATESKA
jgi:O-Antigen ligase